MSPWTIQKLLNWSTEYFRGKGIETARLDAEILLSFVLGLKRLDLYLQFERPVEPDELAKYKALIQRRLRHEPVAYLVGKKEFWSRDFFVTPDVLIPRPDTEILVETLLDLYKKATGPLTGFEFGLGSGIISITLLKELPSLTMHATEISAKAIEIAKKNARNHAVDQRLTVSDQSLSEQILEPSTYDFICSNPPYVATDKVPSLQPSVKDHEPHLALDGGANGLNFYPPPHRACQENPET